MDTKCVLIVDDEPDIREVAQVSLEMMGGWQVLTSDSGRDGLAKAKSAQPNAILLDVMLPDMDGPTTFQNLQADPLTAHIPVIFLTAKIQPVDRARFTNLGVTAVIAKPFDPLTLAKQVAEVLGW
ncbi:response regulator [Pseudanabaena sp. PCC 6802]|uniref:response regulator n=1 Tax=Pseudanabaena sp. PCC 6802 TaxID=118173 RepID=UPI00034B7373|nr:response regulator [Pseudanabaena sp. PCC 6802]